MTLFDFLLLFLLTFVFVITPGPGVMAVFGKHLTAGFLPAFYLSLGMVAADLLYLGVVIFSLDLLAQTIMPFMQYVKIFGSIYLIYLGVSIWHTKNTMFDCNVSKQSVIKEFLTGFFIGITNPKVMIFYIALLPAFIDLSSVSMHYAVQIILTVGLSLLLGIILINLIIGRIRTLFTQSNLVNKVIAVIMIAAGLLLGLA